MFKFLFFLIYIPIIWKTLLYLNASFPISYPDTSKTQSIHQIFGLFNDEMPQEWVRCSRTWQSFPYRRWNKTECISAIQTAMPHRRELIDYEGVQLGDVCRVAVLYLHGGVYTDMDICAKKHTRFPVCDACFVKTSVGVSNDFIVVRKGHPVLLSILESYANSKWMDIPVYLPYIRTMFTTGPVQFSLAVKSYPGIQTVTYASMSLLHIRGSSWHSWDSSFFMHPFIWALVLIWILCMINAKTFHICFYYISNSRCCVRWSGFKFGSLAFSFYKRRIGCDCCFGLPGKSGSYGASSHSRVH